MQDVIKNTLLNAIEYLNDLLNNDNFVKSIQIASEAMIKAINNGGKIISCGNGGSMSDAMHFAEELTGRYRKSRRSLPAIAISDPGYLTCVGNDFGYQDIFSRFVDAHGKKGDCLLAITTSGNSANVIKAAESAKILGVTVIGLTGNSDSTIAQHADILITTSAGKYADRIQELHIKVIHILIELIERHFFPQHYLD